MLVEDLLHLSPLRVVTARPDNSIAEAASRMARFGVGILLVMGNDDEVVGVLSERDIVVGIASTAGGLDRIEVGAWMTASVVTISPKDTLVDAALTMNAHGIRHLIAVEDGLPVGVLSIRDVLRFFARKCLEDGGGDSRLEPGIVKAMAAA